MASMQKKNFGKPDDVRTFDKGKVELVALGGVTFGLAVLEPGWRWSTCVKPLVKTKSCEAPHLQYHIAGRLAVRMDDGAEAEYGSEAMSCCCCRDTMPGSSAMRRWS